MYQENPKRTEFTKTLRLNWRTIVLDEPSLHSLLREFGGTVDFPLQNGYHWQLSVNPGFRKFRLELWDAKTPPREVGFFDQWRAEPIMWRPIPMSPGVIILPREQGKIPAWHSLADFRTMTRLGISSLYDDKIPKILKICERKRDHEDGYCHSDIWMMSANGTVAELLTRAEGKHEINIPDDVVILISSYTNEKTKKKETTCWCTNTTYLQMSRYSYELSNWLNRIKNN